MKYRVLNYVEINGDMRRPASGKRPADIVDESELQPSTGKMLDDGTIALSEAASLLLTGHIERVME